MTKNEYIRKLKHALRKLPKQERQDAIAYYMEYFEDAGIENENAIMNELGRPEELAKKITIDCVEKQYEEQIENATDKKSDRKKDIGNIWIIFLAICALPVSPVILAFAIIVLVTIGIMFLTIGILILTGAVVAIAGAATTIVGIVLVFTHPANGTLMTGGGILMVAIGLLIFLGFILLWDMLIRGVISIGHKFIKKKAVGM